MPKTLENQSSDLQQQGSLQVSKLQPTVPPLQLLTLKVRTLNLAVPIQSVYKVTHHKAVYDSGLNAIGIARVDNQDITVVDLHRYIFKSPFPHQARTAQPCLIVIKEQRRELYGLLTEETPTLIDMPPGNIRVLPETYRRADTLGIASHVAIAPQGDTKQTIFLLDINLLLKNSSRQI